MSQVNAMSQIEIDINDWRIGTHLPDALWRRFAHGGLRPKEENALQVHLLICPCCQEQLTALMDRSQTGPRFEAAAA